MVHYSDPYRRAKHIECVFIALSSLPLSKVISEKLLDNIRDLR